MKIGVCPLFFCVPLFGFGDSEAGTSGAQFLKIGPGARPAAMGEAYSAVADDVLSIHYNPAGLAHLKRVEVSAMHQSHFQGIRYEFAAVSVPVLRLAPDKRPLNALGVLGLSVANLSVSEIERRGLAETDTPADTFGAQDFAYTLGYGYPLDPTLAVGGSVKFVTQRLDRSRATAAALDLGSLKRFGAFGVAAGLRNLGTRPKFEEVSDPLPFLVYGGACWTGRSLRLASEARLPRDGGLKISFGTEYVRAVSEDTDVSFRAGFAGAYRDPGGTAGFSLGGGVRYRKLSFDFGWSGAGGLGNAFRYSLLFKF